MADDDQTVAARRGQDFHSVYANNVGFLPTLWDIRLLFGTQEQTETGENYVQQRSSVTVSWSEAKVIGYLLLMHVRAYELANGVIRIPDEGLPGVPAIPDELKDNPVAQEQYRMMTKLREDFFKNQGP